jgi:hypothetical protein
MGNAARGSGSGFSLSSSSFFFDSCKTAAAAAISTRQFLIRCFDAIPGSKPPSAPFFTGPAAAAVVNFLYPF